MSGMIACIASIERPQVFQKLVLLSASPRWISPAVPSSHCVPATVWTKSPAIFHIFPFGCCDHRFSFLQLAVLGHRTILLVKYWPIAGAVSQTVNHHAVTNLSLLSWKHVFPKFLAWLITYFQCTCTSPMERTVPAVTRNKALRQWLSIRLLLCAVITTA
jgi:hypothetical protein